MNSIETTTTLEILDPHLRELEMGLNKKGATLLSPLSGLFRVTYGILEVELALIMAVKLFAQSFFAESGALSFLCSEKDQNFYLDKSKYQLLYVGHGLANIVRGLFETFLPMIGGVILTSTYDHCEWRFSYDGNRALGIDEGEMFLPELEKVLNELGHIPFMSKLSGMFRIQYGLFQVVTSLILAVPQAMRSVYEGGKSFTVSKRELENAGHGLCNIFRGYIEMWLFIGNIAATSYDGADQRYLYPQEANKKREVESSFAACRKKYSNVGGKRATKARAV